MNVGIGNKAGQFHFWEYINRIFGTVHLCAQVSQVTRALTCLLANNEDMSSLYLTQAGRRVEEHQGTVYTRFES
jgi:hypothetical protein